MYLLSQRQPLLTAGIYARVSVVLPRVVTHVGTASNAEETRVLVHGALINRHQRD